MMTSREPFVSLQKLWAGEQRMLALMATGAPLHAVLDAFVHSYETSFSGVICSILLVNGNGQQLHHGAAPSLPQAFCDAIEGLTIGARAGSCGTAAFTGKTVIVADIATDPLWADFADLALSFSLRACWSVPIMSTHNKVLGTFATYYHEPRTPHSDELLAIERSGSLIGLLIEHSKVAQDVQTQRAALHESEERYRTLVEWSPQAVVVHRDGLILYVNAAAARLMRAPSTDELIGRSLGDALLPQDREDGLARARAALHRKSSGRIRLERLRRFDGSTVDVEVQNTVITYHGEPAVYLVANDISKRLEAEETIHSLAFYDPLTGLPNRRLLMDRLQQALLATGRKHQFGALMLLDLDNFKNINDLVGHDVGDQLLKQVASRLQHCIRKSDSVARVGGDSFMVLLETSATTAVESAQYAENIAAKISAALSEPYTLDGLGYTCTPSIGIVVFHQGTDVREEVAKKADAAMYQAKSAGRNTLRFFDPGMQAQAQARAEFEQTMRLGFENREFSLNYQIQVDIFGQTTGVEALVRWHSNKLGSVSPAQFIPVAEDNGLILPIGQFVLETACAQLMVWAHHPVMATWTVAVNVSARQFAQERFVLSVAEALQKTGANPALLKLELTESMLVKNVHHVIEKMNAVKSMGVSFSLDDFGTGYSSLSYLKLLPLAQLKIDQSFVRDLLTDNNDTVIARTIIALGHSLGMKVIAEGVETPDQRAMLTEMGCDAFQGYYFGRPVPAADLLPPIIIPHAQRS